MYKIYIQILLKILILTCVNLRSLLNRTRTLIYTKNKRRYVKI